MSTDQESDVSNFTRYVREIRLYDLLTPEDEIRLAARISKGDEKAREEMIVSNLKLVIKIAKKYTGLGVPLLDLINEGNIGLMKAVERFDPKHGAKFSTYGAFWIKQGIKRSLENDSRTIRVPSHMHEKRMRVSKARRRLIDELGREPTNLEIAEEIGTRPSEIRDIVNLTIGMISLDQRAGEGHEPIQEFVADENAECPGTKIPYAELVRMLFDASNVLSERERRLLRYRFGLDGENPKTLEEIGPLFGITRERVRQIQLIAFKKIRRWLKKVERIAVESD